jgi:carbamoyltransferase
MYILGVSCYYHDSAVVLLQDGVLVAAAEEERFTRKKHDNSFPQNAINFCLRQAGITGQDLDYVVFYEKPLVKFERILLTALGTFPHSYPVFRESMVAWFNEKLWIKSKLQTSIGVTPERILFIEHHLSHAASTLYASPFAEAAILTIDGVGEWTTAAVGRGTAVWDRTDSQTNADDLQVASQQQENKIELFREIRFPHSLGLLYSAFTAFLGFKVNNGEYKVMGMAPYGTPRYFEEVHRLINVDDDGGFRLNMDYFSFHHSTHRTFNDHFVELFGPPRQPESEFFTLTTNPTRNHPHWSDQAAAQNQKYADIAASIQKVTEEIMLKMANYAYRETGCKNLVMAGGVTLNSVANGRIIKETPFENVYIQPAAGDAGGALGAALYVYHVLLGQPRRFVMEHAYWGAEYSMDDMKSSIQASGFRHEYIEEDEKLLDRVVERLMQGKVVSWYRGRFEWGPRALGHRSILADPRSAEMKEVVNTKIKFREPFRPFAPVVLEERAAEYFDFPAPERYYPARFMLLVTPIPEDKRDQLQAVCHVGGTGRLQTIRREWNPAYYRVVEKFGEATGVPVLLNTSYNLRGEPIVNTPANALNTFAKSDIDALVMGQYLVSKT